MVFLELFQYVHFLFDVPHNFQLLMRIVRFLDGKYSPFE